jgi:hypothetical protein
MSLVSTPCHISGLSTLQTRTTAISEPPSDTLPQSLSTPEFTSAPLKSSRAYSSILKGSWNTGFRWPSPISLPPSPNHQLPSAYLPPSRPETPSPSSYLATFASSPTRSCLCTGSKTSSSVLQSHAAPTRSSMLSSTISSTTSTPAIVVVPITTAISSPAIVVVPITPTLSMLAHHTLISVVGKAPEAKDAPSPTCLHHTLSCTQNLSSSFRPTTTTTHETITITLAASHPSCTHPSAASDHAIYTTVPPADPRCPYPFPGIKCYKTRSGGTSTFVAQTKMGKGAGVSMSVTEGARGSESRASAVECPYPGQKC